MSEKLFRFQDMEIWKRAASLSHTLFDFADELERKRCYRFAEQLRAATLSVTNNIAEGSGSVSDAEFANFLNIARRSVFEVANILLLLSQRGYFQSTTDKQKESPSAQPDRIGWTAHGDPEMTAILDELQELSRMIFAFRRNLKS